MLMCGPCLCRFVTKAVIPDRWYVISVMHNEMHCQEDAFILPPSSTLYPFDPNRTPRNSQNSWVGYSSRSIKSPYSDGGYPSGGSRSDNPWDPAI